MAEEWDTADRDLKRGEDEDSEFVDTFLEDVEIEPPDGRCVRLIRVRKTRAGGDVSEGGSQFTSISHMYVQKDGKEIYKNTVALPSYVTQDDVAQLLKIIGRAYGLDVKVTLDMEDLGV